MFFLVSPLFILAHEDLKISLLEKKSLKSTLNFKVCPCNQTHQISGLISANNISLWVTFYLESEIPILAKIDLIRPYLSIGSRKNVQKSVFSWFKINNGTPKFLCCLVNHQEMSHNFVKLHFHQIWCHETEDVHFFAWNKHSTELAWKRATLSKIISIILVLRPIYLSESWLTLCWPCQRVPISSI